MTQISIMTFQEFVTSLKLYRLQIAVVAFALLIVALFVLNYIPPVIFGGFISGIIGAGIALYGTKLQNEANSKRQKELLDEQSNQQKERLEHEAKQRKLEREMIMRRDIYLDGIEAVGNMQQFLMAFSNINQTTEARESVLTDIAPALNKVAVIANLDTIEALNKINVFYTRNLTALIEKRMEIDNNIQYKNNLENSIQTLFQRNQQLINFLNPPNNLTVVQIGLINSEHQNNYKEINNNQDIIKELEHQTLDQVTDLLNRCFQNNTEFIKLGADAILCIRRELDFPIDETRYKNMIEETAREDAENVTTWYKDWIEKHRHEL